jgi:hypothetical protein
METTDSENSVNESPKLPMVKRGRGRPKTAPWRSEGEKYNSKPVSESYFRDYYGEHLRSIYVECPHCHKQIGKHNYTRHLASGKKCLKIRNLDKNI